MFGRRLILTAATLFTVTLFRADCVNDHRPTRSSGILITDFTISGTATLGSGAMSEITNELVGSCLSDSSEELEERIRALFQDRGYFAVEVKNVRIKRGDALETPKPVSVEAEVSEGMRYRVQKINVVGNRAFSRTRIVGRISLHKGDVFERRKIAGSFAQIRELYVPAGFLTMFFVPETTPHSDGTITLAIKITEGPQYHMGKFDVVARKDDAERLRAAWRLTEGAPYDATYIPTYIAENRSILPTGFNEQGVEVVTDCPQALVTVRVIVDPFDPKAQTPVKSVPCDSESDRN